MNTGQTMMVIAAMMLLGTLSLSVNGTLINSTATSLEMEAGLDALSYGQSLMDEILSKDFDAKTVNKRAFNYTEITNIDSLGPEEGSCSPDSSMTENFKSKWKYDDVDDYNDYIRIGHNSRLDYFTDSVKVEYVSEDNVETLATSATFYKRVTIKISNRNMVKDLEGNVFPLVIWDLAVYRRYF